MFLKKFDKITFVLLIILVALIPVTVIGYILFHPVAQKSRINVLVPGTGPISNCKKGISTIFTGTDGKTLTVKYSCYDNSSGTLSNINPVFQTSLKLVVDNICQKLSNEVCPLPTGSQTITIAPVTVVPTLSCYNLCLKYGYKTQYGACGIPLSTTQKYWCGPSNDPARANLCYYNIYNLGNPKIDPATTVCRSGESCLCYDRQDCSSNNSSCKASCSPFGCVKTVPTGGLMVVTIPPQNTIYTPTPAIIYRPTSTPAPLP